MTQKKIKPQSILQGNKPGDDPKKYGLKFDGGKARWDLVPMVELQSIIAVPTIYLECNERVKLTEFDRNDLYNVTMNIITDNEDVMFPIVGFNLFYLLRGKPYTVEELGADNNELRWDLFDINEIQKVAEVYGYGAALYAPENWKNVNRERYYSALLRHFKTIRTKERFDGESGFLHLHHAIWNVIALMWLDNHKKGGA